MINTIREAVQLKDDADQPIWIGKDWMRYEEIRNSESPEWITIGLYESGRHFNIKFADLVFFYGNKDGIQPNEFLAFKNEALYFSTSQMPIHEWSKKEIETITQPQRIIRMALLEMIVAPFYFPFELALKIDIGKTYVWLPKSYDGDIEIVKQEKVYKSPFFQKVIRALPMETIAEEIDDFYSLLDNKLMDLLFFTMASIVHLWQNEGNKKDEFLKNIFNSEKQLEVKRELMTHIYLYKMR